ncbi:MAG: AAA family ATPase [Rhodocyclaceae bacterium]|nr:AAA family ATPase [Rhodocyclaceae bacterium]
MYNAYFGFSVSPFENSLDQRFLFLSAGHKEVIAALRYFIQEKKGFALVCGDIGTGKTMLINTLLNRLPDTVHPILIANPDVGYVEIMGYIAGILEIDVNGKRVLELIDRVKEALVAACGRGNHFVLIVDEAHLLPARTMEQIRLLSNIETPEHKLFQILLLGQYELSYKLSRPGMRQLRQRIGINRFLAPMDAAETIRYIDHRLRQAGSGFTSCFESDCSSLIYKLTNGIPRSINNLCDSALLICMADKQQRVTRRILKKADHALHSDVLYTPAVRAGRSSGFRKTLGRSLAAAAGVILLTLLGIAGYRGLSGPGTVPSLPVQEVSAPPGDTPRHALPIPEEKPEGPPVLSMPIAQAPEPQAPESLASGRSQEMAPLPAEAIALRQNQADDAPSEPPVAGTRIWLKKEIHFLP